MVTKERSGEGVSVGFVGSYIPRRCGIATFTHDLASAIAELTGENLDRGEGIQIVALNNMSQGYPYPPQVKFEIRDRYREDYREAAEFLNIAPIDVVSLQHEFGILGGEDPDYIMALLGNLKKPVVTTLHTVLHKPDRRLKDNLKRVCSLSTFVVVMAERARNMLKQIYGIPEEKIRFVHHGVPDVPFMDTSFYKDQFYVEGRPVVLTFGLLSPNKGIEVSIDAIAEVVKKYPEVAYLVLGATHPDVKRYNGEEYRLSLERRVIDKNLTENIIFHNRYVDLGLLCEFLLAADVYVTPYWSREQIVSGTLAYAIGCGKAIISTPYWYAEEMLADKRGILTPCGDSDELAHHIVELITNQTRRDQMRKQAYIFGRRMIWKEVARSYVQLFEEALERFAQFPPSVVMRKRPVPRPSLPKVNLKHLQTMTDDTGLLHHAIYATPDCHHGYYTDDNARALVVVAHNWRLFKDETIMPLFNRYLSFLNYAFNESSGQFKNHLGYNRVWAEEIGSDECHGYAMWGLGAAVAFAPNTPILRFASRLFSEAMSAVEQLSSSRALAFVLFGIHEYLRRFSGASEVRRLREHVAIKLFDEFKQNSSDDWPWLEDAVTSHNGALPHALILAGRWMENGEMLDQGFRTLEWLFKIQTDAGDGHLCPIGNDGWYPQAGNKAKFDQQPGDVSSLIDAAREAYLVTGDKIWHDQCLRVSIGFLDQMTIKNRCLTSQPPGAATD